MIGTVTVGGRTIDSALLSETQDHATTCAVGLLSLSRWFCDRLAWRNPRGDPCISSAAKALRCLEARGLIDLPWETRSRGEIESCDFEQVPVLPKTIGGRVNEHRLDLVLVDGGDSQDGALWKALVAQYHPLGSRPLFGAQLRYLVRCDGHWIGALGFSASAFQVAARDRYIGWSTGARKAHLQEVVNNSRFLVRPGVRVKNLGSHVLSLATKRLPRDWQERYGYRPLLVESYVEEGRPGTSYRGAGWREVGKTAGRGRQDAARERAVSRKRIFLFPLVDGWQRRLCRELPAKKETRGVCLPLNTRRDAAWLEEELAGAEIGDKRLAGRLITIAKDFWSQPSGSVLSSADSDRARVKAAYRFLNNKAVTMEKILKPHYASTVGRIEDWGREQHHQETDERCFRPVVLACQDTTTITYRNRPATTGIGYINDPNDNARGFLVHDTLTLTPDGLALGLLDVQAWARDESEFGKKKQRKGRSIEEKESNKWLLSYEAVSAAQRLLPNVQLVSVGDRQSDVFELFALANSRNDHPQLLVRAEHDRNILMNGKRTKLWDALEGTAVKTLSATYVPRRSSRGKVPAQEAREAVLEVRFASVTLLPPQKNPAARREGPQAAWAVHAKEREAPAGVEPLEWMLLTTISISTAEEAKEKICWYTRRFQIEVYHKVIKSGCGIEMRQNRRAHCLQNALAIDMIVAWRIMYLMALSRTVPDMPCTAVLDEYEWKSLYAFIHKSPEAPTYIPSLNDAIRMAARLGGFLGRPSDGDPGVKAMWKGLTRLADIAASWLAFGPCSIETQAPPTATES